MKLCTIEADLSRAPKAKGKGSFYRVDCDIILLFGTTELKAQLAWKEKVSVVSICRSIQQIYVLFYARFLGKRETVSFKKDIVS